MLIIFRECCEEILGALGVCATIVVAIVDPLLLAALFKVALLVTAATTVLFPVVGVVDAADKLLVLKINAASIVVINVNFFIKHQVIYGQIFFRITKLKTVNVYFYTLQIAQKIVTYFCALSDSQLVFSHMNETN